MWCSGFLSKEKLDAQLKGPNRNYFENRGGEAQVVSLNGLVASQAVTEVLQLLTGFGGSGLRRRDVALDEQSRSSARLPEAQRRSWHARRLGRHPTFRLFLLLLDGRSRRCHLGRGGWEDLTVSWVKSG